MTFCPHTGSLMPTTAESATPGCLAMLSSTCTGWMFSPPEMIMSSLRPRMVTNPSSSQVAMSGIEPAVVELLLLDLGQIHVLEPGLRAAHDHFAGFGAVLSHRLVGVGTSVVEELDHADIVIGARPAR